MSRLIDADKLKQHYAWWEGGSAEMTLDEAKKTFYTIIDVQPTVEQPQTNATESSPQFYYSGAVKVVRSADGRPYPVLSYHDAERKEDAETN